jgi:hypothetical protein
LGKKGEYDGVDKGKVQEVIKLLVKFLSFFLSPLPLS